MPTILANCLKSIMVFRLRGLLRTVNKKLLLNIKLLLNSKLKEAVAQLENTASCVSASS